MKFETKGFDELHKKLEDWKNRAEKLSKEKQVSFSELFDKTFMKKYTNFSTFDELLENGNFVATTNEEFEAIPDDEFDLHVSKTTKFSCWGDMLNKATELYATRKLGF